MRTKPCAVCGDYDPCACRWEAREKRGVKARILSTGFSLIGFASRGLTYGFSTFCEYPWVLEKILHPLWNAWEKAFYVWQRLAIRWRPRIPLEQALEELVRALAATEWCSCGKPALADHDPECEWSRLSSAIALIADRLGLKDIADCEPLWY